jgi:hypothetical protein
MAGGIVLARAIGGIGTEMEVRIGGERMFSGCR